ncbi:uncharacterized protein LOC131246884 isoform X2 [Magnolia sinica]|uniref:uncharacterized protein LOC131246884 isoform X2 n=1 Tax=Magnolia sinica TaxID=86752 RepID=UPI00265B369E|nr:uncharacterized protein LOC131246884 isoform X2 [Magnolia sinica]
MEMDAVQVEPQPPRFQRTDQWMPVYSWLESLEKNEVVKPNEIIDWLSENPGVRDQLHSKHSRHHLMHYIQRCHFKMLRRRERQRKRMQAMQPPTTSPEVKALNNGVTTAAVPLRCKISSTLLKDNDMSLSKKNEALRRYELLTDLQSQLISLLSNHKQANNSKESVSPPSLMQRSTENANNQLSDGGVKEGNISVMSGGASHCQESSLVSPLDSGSGRKRKRHAAVVTPVGSYCEAAAGAGNGFELDAGSHGGYAGRHREKWIPSSEDMLSLPLAGSHLVDNFRNLLWGLNGEVTHHGFLHGVPIHQAWLLHNPFSRYACQIMVF